MKICLFSGGFDSTYMLYRLFSEGDDKVLIISAIPDKGYSGEKIDREKEARKNIIEYLSKKYPKTKYEVSEVGINHGIVKSGVRRALVQPITWMDALITSSIFQECTENDNIIFYMSYIKGDDALQKRYDIENIINSSFNILFIEDCRPDVKVVFPLCNCDKSEVIFNLMSAEIDLCKLATTCENAWSKSDDCGECRPCSELKWALIKLTTTSHSGRIRELAASELERRFGCSIEINDVKKKKTDMKDSDISFDNEKDFLPYDPSKMKSTKVCNVGVKSKDNFDKGDMLDAPIMLADVITNKNGITKINIPEKALRKTKRLQVRVLSNEDENLKNEDDAIVVSAPYYGKQ